jgi:Fe-S-cluster-containing dehydrogenase component
MKTACVDACPFGARLVGNLKDPNDPVTRIVLSQRVAVLKDAFGTKPQVYYLGMDENVR